MLDKSHNLLFAKAFSDIIKIRQSVIIQTPD